MGDKHFKATLKVNTLSVSFGPMLVIWNHWETFGNNSCCFTCYKALVRGWAYILNNLKHNFKLNVGKQ